MNPVGSPGLIPIGDSPSGLESSRSSPRRSGSFRSSGSFSFRNIGRKSLSPGPVESNVFLFDETEIEKDKIIRKSSNPFKSPGRHSFRMKNGSKDKDKELIGEMNSESGRIRQDQTQLRKSFESYDPDQYRLFEGEERRYLDPESQKLPEVQKVLDTLKSWINDELGKESTRMQVSSLEEDLADGLILKHLVEILSGEEIKMPFGEYAQSKERQQRNIKAILTQIENVIQCDELTRRWSAESVFAKNLLSIVHLLLAIVAFYQTRKNIHLDLPKSLNIDVLVVRSLNGSTTYKKENETLFGFASQRGDFDVPLNQDKEEKRKLEQNLLSFTNSHLGKLGRVVHSLENEFKDGTNLLMLIGLLEEFFIPLYYYHINPKSDDEKLSNIRLAFQYLEETGMDWNNHREARPGDILRGDQKTLRNILLALLARHNK